MPPAAALAVMGKAGGALIAVIVLMAITSSGSAEMVAVSSLITYDIYRVFCNKKATGECHKLRQAELNSMFTLSACDVCTWLMPLRVGFAALRSQSAEPPLAPPNPNRKV